MTRLKLELNIEDLDRVAGGQTPIYGMNCSLNQGKAIQAVGDAMRTIPVVGDLLAGVVQVAGWIICA